MEQGFFQVISVDEFLNRLRRFRPVERVQRLPIAEAAGRTLGLDITAEEDVPPFSRSCMDGYAVRAADTFGAGEFQPVYLQAVQPVAMGSLPDFTLRPGQCSPIATGAALPEGADAVIMIEHTVDFGSGDIEIQRSLAPGDNVLLQGEDSRRGEVQLQAGVRLEAQQIGLLAALGQPEVTLVDCPRVGVISTGDEIVPIESTPPPGCIRDINSTTLSAWTRRSGSLPIGYGLVPDQPQALRERLEEALGDCDCVFISGGSSVGTRDVTLEVLEGLAQESILAHGVALSPGKPTILADIAGTPVFGLPGQVTSAQVVFFVLCQPFLRYLSGQTRGYPHYLWPRLTARLSRNLPSTLGRDDYIRIKLTPSADGSLRADPLLGKSGLLNTLLQADGLACIPSDTEGLDRGSLIDVWLL
jgi:molybdopterin molybdotransferase